MKWHCSQRKQSATVTDFPKDPVRWARQAFPILQLSKPRFREGLWKFLSAVIWESPICSDLGYFYKVETRKIPRFPRNFFFVCFFIYLPSPSLQSYTKKRLGNKSRSPLKSQVQCFCYGRQSPRSKSVKTMGRRDVTE